MASCCRASLSKIARRTSLHSRQTISRRCMASTSAAPAATSSSTPPPPPSSPLNPKIDKLVDEISGLTLLQAADLVSLLKSRLNIQDIALPAASAAPAAAPVAEDDAPVEEKPKEKTIFNVKLEAFDAASKAKIIKEIKALIPNLNLMEAKKFVESLPRVMKENLPKEEAEKLKETFVALGATVTLE